MAEKKDSTVDPQDVTEGNKGDVIDQVSYPPDAESEPQQGDEAQAGSTGQPQPWGADQITPYPEVAAAQEEELVESRKQKEEWRQNRAKKADEDEAQAHNVSGGQVGAAGTDRPSQLTTDEASGKTRTTKKD